MLRKSSNGVEKTLMSTLLYIIPLLLAKDCTNFERSLATVFGLIFLIF